jgi:hypothetical protein
MTMNEFIAEIERRAAAEGIAPSTYCERAGQGGKFFHRIKSGARCWPETVEKVLAVRSKTQNEAAE